MKQPKKPAAHDVSVSNFSCYGTGGAAQLQRAGSLLTQTSMQTDVSPLSKRTFKQLSRNWDLNYENSDVDTIVANESSVSGLAQQKRTVKMERKLVAKICRVIDLAKSQGRFFPSAGFRHQETVTACFSTVIYDIAKDYMYQFVQND